MNKKQFIIIGLLILFGVFSSFAQDRNNEEEVVLMENTKGLSKEGEIIVKFSDNTRLRMDTLRGSVQTGIASVDALFQTYGVESIERICPHESSKTTKKTIRTYNGQEIIEPDLSRLCLIKIADQRKVEDLMTALKALEEVEFAEPNYLLFALSMPEEVKDVETTGRTNKRQPLRNGENYFDAADYLSEPMYALQWGIAAVGLDSLWMTDTNSSTRRAVIAILDTGVDPEHPDLVANIWHNPNETADGLDNDNNGYADDITGWDFVNQSAVMRDNNSHGTHCAGIAAAVGDNGIGITGANPKALIMPITVLQSNGAGDVATIIQGINYARDNGADVINMSFGTYSHSLALEQALSLAYQSAVLVAAAGNDGLPMDVRCGGSSAQPVYPAAYNFVLGVQATLQGTCPYRPLGQIACYSNWDCDGPQFSQFGEEQLYNYELAAPGTDIISTVPNGMYRSYNGTSMSAPLVAGGVSALLHAKAYPNQELLWGDLINSTTAYNPVNFYRAYQTNNPPAKLQVVTYQLIDTVSGDGDYRADAGERVELYPTLRNVWSNTDSITCWLEFSEFEDTTLLHFQHNYVNFGYPLASYAHHHSLEPIRFTVDSNVVDGRIICLTICAVSPNIQDTLRHPIEFSVENGVELHGMLTQNTTLYPNVHYIVTNTLAVPEGITLTILPGTTLKIATGVSIAVAGKLIARGTPDSLITFTKTDLGENWGTFRLSDYDTMAYCILEYGRISSQIYDNTSLLDNLIIRYTTDLWAKPLLRSNVIYNSRCSIGYDVTTVGNAGNYNNYVCNHYGYSQGLMSFFSRFGCDSIHPLNVFNNEGVDGNSFVTTYYDLHLDINNSYNYAVIPISTIYLGTSKESIANNHVYDMNTLNSNAFADIDVSTMCRRPHRACHGVVWKVLVNGHDAQDEFDSIIPLGIGRHRFDVCFNRAMDTAVAPLVAMGVRPPYTQHYIDKDGCWSSDSVYTAYLDITSSTVTDGLNRIYVADARDDEHFEIPYENRRFNVQVATAGMGQVELQWEQNGINTGDLLGYNIYRYQLVSDSIETAHQIVNSYLIQDSSFIDYNVVPGECYYYYYKAMRTDLSESVSSHVVSAVPLTTLIGDVNGSMAVDVADVVSLIAYLSGQNANPFIYAAADVNGDGVINVLDVVGILNIIVQHPSSRNANPCANAAYFITNDTLYVESPVDIAGLQLNLRLNGAQSVLPLSALQGFERVWVSSSDSAALFMAFNMQHLTIPAGKHPLLLLNRAEIEELILSDPDGCEIAASLVDESLGVEQKDTPVQLRQPYPNPFGNTVHIPVIIGKEFADNAEIRVTDMMGKLIERFVIRNMPEGSYDFLWHPAAAVKTGFYFVVLNGKHITPQTAKIIYVK